MEEASVAPVAGVAATSVAGASEFRLIVQPLVKSMSPFVLTVASSSTVSLVKSELAGRLSAPSDQLEVLCAGRLLKEDDIVSALPFAGIPSVMVCTKASPAEKDIASSGKNDTAAAVDVDSDGGGSGSGRRSAPHSPRDAPGAAPVRLPSMLPVEALPVNPVALQLMLDMGFLEMQARKALLLHMMDVERAAAWLLEHADDGEADGPLNAEQVQLLARLYDRAVASAPRPPPVVEPAVAAAIERGQCTFAVTGRQFATQQWVHCFTCGLIGDKGCCLACARVCHAGHKLSAPRPLGSFFCDCGSAALPTVQCRAMEVPGGVPPCHDHAHQHGGGDGDGERPGRSGDLPPPPAPTDGSAGSGPPAMEM